MTDLAERRLHQQLRTWAAGVYPVEAATELLIRTGHAQATRPWIRPFDDQDGGPETGHWVDFDIIPDHLADVSSGQRRLLLIAAAVGSDTARVNLNDAVGGLDRTTLDLVLGAVAHAGGSHQGVTTGLDHRGQLTVSDVPGALYPWPEPGRPPR